MSQPVLDFESRLMDDISGRQCHLTHCMQLMARSLGFSCPVWTPGRAFVYKCPEVIQQAQLASKAISMTIKQQGT